MDDEEKLELGKGVAFVKSRLKRLTQGDDTWKADFEALPEPIMQTETHYLGIAGPHPRTASAIASSCEANRPLMTWSRM